MQDVWLIPSRQRNYLPRDAVGLFVAALTLNPRVDELPYSTFEEGRPSMMGPGELLGDHLRKLVPAGVRKLLLNLVNLTRWTVSGISVIVGLTFSSSDRVAI